MKRAGRCAVAVLAVWAVWATFSASPSAEIPPYGGADAYRADLAARRAATMAALGPDAALVLWSAGPRVYSTDTNYEYRQESNLLYLSGIEEENTILVLTPGAEVRERFFVPASDPYNELWFGHLLTPPEVTATSGVASVTPERNTEAFDAFMTGLLGGPAAPSRLCVLEPVGGSVDAEAVVDSHAGWLREMTRRYPRVSACSAGDILARQRSIKTAYEQRVLRRSVEISAEAHIEGMKAARPGRWEYEVEAAIEYWFLKNGAMSWGYPSIVASGPNATTLHYEKSTRQMRDGDLLLVDAAGDFQGLTGDITRTYPVNGKFSPDQRAIYELVLRAQDAGLAAAKPGSTANDITRAVRAVFAEGLPKLGLVDPSAGDVERQVSLWFPHGPTHGIGVDVHDPLGKLDPGAAFVIEPGLYIRPDTLANLPDTPENRALARALGPAVERFKNIGVRIEDSFLMTPAGPERLSDRAPRQIADIERIVGTGR